MRSQAFKETCGRCAGTGHYSFNLVDGTRCYGCGGSGVKIFKTSPEVRAAAKARRDEKRAARAASAEAKARKANAPIMEMMSSLVDDPRCTPIERSRLQERGPWAYEMASAIIDGRYRPWLVRGLIPACDAFRWVDGIDTDAINRDVQEICEALANCPDPDDQFLLSLLRRAEEGRELTPRQRKALARL